MTPISRMYKGDRMKLYCFECGKPVTNEISENIIFRAIAQCLECIDKHSPREPLPLYGKLPEVLQYNSLLYGWFVSWDNGKGERHSFDGQTKSEATEKWNKFCESVIQND